MQLLPPYSHHLFFSEFSVLERMMRKFTDKCLFSLFMRSTKKEWAMCLTRKFSFGKVARLQCGGEINVFVLKSWMWPVPIVLPHTYHIVHKTCIKKGQALSGSALYTYWCLWLMHGRGLNSARDWNFVFLPFQVFLPFLHFTNRICGRSNFSTVYVMELFSCLAYSSNNIHIYDFYEGWYRYLVIRDHLSSKCKSY